MPNNHRVLILKEDMDKIVEACVETTADPYKWQATYNTKDKIVKYYASKTIGGRKGKKWKMHRLIFVLRKIEIEGKEIDHINGDTLDNRFFNLRLVNSSQNKGNSSIRSDNKSGYKGVGWHKQNSKWRAYIGTDAKSLGLYDTEEEAALAYNIAAIQKWGPYAKLNTLPKPK